MLVPEPPNALLPVFISLTSVQELPFQDSTAFVLGAGGEFPPNTNPAGYVPAAPMSDLVVFVSATSAQFVPLKYSQLFK